MPDENDIGVALPDASTVEAAIKLGAAELTGSTTARLDARVLLKAVLKTDEAGLIAMAHDRLSDEQQNQFSEYVLRRAQGEPVAQIIGVKEFWSLPFAVNSNVLTPRNDSECLIEEALKRRQRDEQLRILDLGTGSGCLLCALLSEFTMASGTGVDRSISALSVASSNADSLGLSQRARFLEGDWFSPLKDKYDLIITNPPYIRKSDASRLAVDVKSHEPHGALFGGSDGLEAYRRILPNIPGFLAEGGLLLMECGFDQTDEIHDMMSGISMGRGEAFTLFDLATRPRGVGFDRRNPKKRD